MAAPRRACRGAPLRGDSAAQFLLTIPADMPFLPLDLLDRLRSRDRGPRLRARQQRRADPSGLRPLAHIDALDRVRDLCRRRAALAERLRQRWSAFARSHGQTNPIDPFFNINTADELAEAEGRARGLEVEHLDRLARLQRRTVGALADEQIGFGERLLRARILERAGSRLRRLTERARWKVSRAPHAVSGRRQSAWSASARARSIAGRSGRRGAAQAAAGRSPAPRSGLPGRPMTSVSPTRPSHTGLPGLIATLEKIELEPERLEHRLGEVLFADRCAAGHDDHVRIARAPPRQLAASPGDRRAAASGRRIGRPIARPSAATPKRNAFRDRVGSFARRAGLGELVAGAEDVQPRPAIDLDLGEIGARRGDQRARVEQPAGGEQFVARREIRAALADMSRGARMLIDDRGVAARGGHSPGSRRGPRPGDRRAGEDAHAGAGRDRAVPSRCRRRNSPTTCNEPGNRQVRLAHRIAVHRRHVGARRIDLRDDRRASTRPAASATATVSVPSGCATERTSSTASSKLIICAASRPICRRSWTSPRSPPMIIVRSIAFSMSNKVRQATETAVSASISTPVTALVRTSDATRKPGSSSSISILHLDLGQRQRMAERDQLGGALGRHDAGELGGLDHRALGRGPGADLVERLGLQVSMPAAVAVRAVASLSGHVDHARPAALVEMGEPAHAQRCLSRGIWPASEQGR